MEAVDRRYSDLVADWLEEAMRAHVDLEYRYEVLMALVGTEKGPQFVCQLLMSIPSPILGQVILQVQQFPVAGVTDLVIGMKVQDMVVALRAEHSRQLTSLS